MKTNEQLMTDIENQQRQAGTDLELVHPHVRAAFQIAAREATEQLTKSLEEYRRRLQSSAIGFFVAGAPAKTGEFRSVAVSAAKSMFFLDGLAVYERIATEVEPTIGKTREFSVQQMNQVNFAIRDIALEAGLRESLTATSLNEVRCVPTHDDLVALVRELVTSALGETFNAEVLSDQFVKQALAAKFTGNVAACIITNANAQVRGALSKTFATKSDVAIEEETEVNEDFVLSVFKSADRSKTESPKTPSKQQKQK